MKLYLACPYSNPDPQVLIDRFEMANKAAASLIAAGHIVFSPISHSHQISLHMGNSLDHTVWLAQDRAFLDWCDEIYVLMAPGWEQSKGVAWEIDYARKHGKAITYIGR